MIKILVDAMGGDNAPSVTVQGSVEQTTKSFISFSQADKPKSRPSLVNLSTLSQGLK